MEHRTADTSPAGPLQAGAEPCASEPLLRPHLARELIAAAEQASTHWSRRIRHQLAAIEVGQARHADHANGRLLGRILAEHGWHGHRLVGREGCRAAWQLALHADDDLNVQRAAARLLHCAVQDDDAPAVQWAHLHDRVLISTGRPQEYGTQYLLTADAVERYPVREPDGLDTRRSRLGLPPAADTISALRRRLALAAAHPDTGDTVVLTPLASAA
ncbi:hypothetical protein QWJ26_13480 [Streptomyces sp. CSDS2]|uniref:DUF6624 domain-containing protein n=1 Tax=Streptomyces sp. CSDS2 TaxID=3055051 RepID=UPI0025AFCA29|nr:DUF6624 domain-containing protein [Streptomyces sp. CSDS2]MDN3260807.1 hypothetical protein [Streptomyces sp. CSDS2]